MSETDRAAIVAEHFRLRGYEVFEEVYLGGRCDVVARHGRMTYAVEVKEAATLAVLAQAVRHHGRAHAVYVAVPMPRARDDFFDLASAARLGVLVVDADGCTEHVPAPLTRWLAPAREGWLRAALTDDHRRIASAAGSQSSRSWTQWRQFQREVWATLRSHGPLTVRELAKRLQEENKRYSRYRWPSDELARRALHSYLGKNLLRCIECVDTSRPAKWGAVGDRFEAA